MSIKKVIFFCLCCNNSAFSMEKIVHASECQFPNHTIQANVSFDLPRKGFSRWFFSVDWGYWLAFMGAVIINALLLPHFKLNFGESILESFCWGFMLIRLFKEQK